MFNMLVTLQPKCNDVGNNASVLDPGKASPDAGSEKSTTFLEG